MPGSNLPKAPIHVRLLAALVAAFFFCHRTESHRLLY
jgi:hypothetical protein